MPTYDPRRGDLKQKARAVLAGVHLIRRLVHGVATRSKAEVERSSVCKVPRVAHNQLT